jgi:hypothetical protein
MLAIAADISVELFWNEVADAFMYLPITPAGSVRVVTTPAFAFSTDRSGVGNRLSPVMRLSRVAG